MYYETNYLAHYGVKGMKWKNHKYATDVLTTAKTTTSAGVAKAKTAAKTATSAGVAKAKAQVNTGGVDKTIGGEKNYLKYKTKSIKNADNSKANFHVTGIKTNTKLGKLERKSARVLGRIGNKTATAVATSKTTKKGKTYTISASKKLGNRKYTSLSITNNASGKLGITTSSKQNLLGGTSKSLSISTKNKTATVTLGGRSTKKKKK